MKLLTIKNKDILKKVTEFFSYVQDTWVDNLTLTGWVIWLTTTTYILLSYSKIPTILPLWYNQPWGRRQLATKEELFVPIIGYLIILISNHYITKKIFIAKEKIIARTILVVNAIIQATYAYGAFVLTQKVINFPIVSTALLTKAIVPAILAGVLTTVITPIVIKIANKNKIVTDPQINKHPAMLLTKPTPRAGASGVVAGIIITCLLCMPLSKKLLGIYLGATLAAIIGVLDDKFDINPYIRLTVLLPLIAILTVGFGLGIAYLTNPLGGVIDLTQVKISFQLWGTHTFLILANAISIIWMLWVMNMLSWSNGVDGQFPGIIAICALALGILSMRSGQTMSVEQSQAITLAFATTGACIGIIRYTWHPCKILIGFGATAIGLIIASLAIFSTSKVAAATMILFIPTIDAIYTIIRRLWGGKSPVWGDREHLHHKLLDLGFTQKQVSLFYWSVSALLAGGMLASSGKVQIFTILTVFGIFISVIIAWQRKERIFQRTQVVAAEAAPKEAALSNEENSEP